MSYRGYMDRLRIEVMWIDRILEGKKRMDRLGIWVVWIDWILGKKNIMKIIM